MLDNPAKPDNMSPVAAAPKHFLTTTSSLGPKLTPFAPVQSQVLCATRQYRRRYHLSLTSSASATSSVNASFARLLTPTCRLFSSTALRQKGVPLPAIGCFRCGSPDHLKRDCTEPKATRRCYNCFATDHLAPTCPVPRRCRRCGSEDHEMTACPKPKACFRCGSEDHTIHDCSQRVSA